MIYSLNGDSMNSAWDASGNSLSQAYDVDGNPLMSSSETHRPIPTYVKEFDEDPDKNITWSYNLEELIEEQGNCFTLGIQADTHFNPSGGYHGVTYATPLKNLTKQLFFDAIVNLGDVPRGSEPDSPATTENALTEIMRRYTDYAEAPFLVARGNHDNGLYYERSGASKTMDEVVSKTSLYNLEIGNVKGTTQIVEPSGTEFYYYKDFDMCRVIVLDTSNYPYQEISDYDINSNHHTISSAQVSWLKTVALNTAKPIVVLSHIALVAGVLPTTGTPWQASTEDKYEGYWNRMPYRIDEVTAALKDFIRNGGTVAACLCGHMHRQDSVTINGINHIVFCSGGEFAEIVFIDFATRTIRTKIVGNQIKHDKTAVILNDREFIF